VIGQIIFCYHIAEFMERKRDKINTSAFLFNIMLICDVTILALHSMAKPASAFSMAEPASVYFKWRYPGLILSFFKKKFPPFSGGLPRVNTRVFFLAFFQWAAQG
jgi:hypothetical protein